MAIVRIYCHAGNANYTHDSPFQLKQPYTEREVIEAGLEPVSTSPKLTAAPTTKFLNVQIQPGCTVAIEMNNNSRNHPADIDSPRYSGDVVFEATVGCTLSILSIHEMP